MVKTANIRKGNLLARVLPALLLAVAFFLAYAAFAVSGYDRIQEQNLGVCQETTSQKVAYLDTTFTSALGTVKSAAYYYGEYDIDTTDKGLLSKLEEETSLDRVLSIDLQGYAHFSDGVVLDLSDQEFFSKGLSGVGGIFVLDKGTFDEKGVICFAAPIRSGGEVTSVLVGLLDDDSISALLEESYDGYAAPVALVSSVGDVMACSYEYQGPDNILSSSDGGFIEADRLEVAFETGGIVDISSDVADGKLGCVKHLATVDWVLVEELPEGVVSAAAREAAFENSKFIIIFALIFVAYLVWLLFRMRRERLIMEAESRDDRVVAEGTRLMYRSFILVDFLNDSYELIQSPPFKGVLFKGSLTDLCEYASRFLAAGPKSPDAISGKELLVIYQELKDKQASGDGVVTLTLPLLKDGKSHWVSVNFLLLPQEGEGIALAAIRTVTDEMERELEAKALLEEALGQAEQANQAKSNFLSSVSHDIRTPMNAIVGFTELARNNVDDPMLLTDYLDKISISGQHMSELINDVLDMSRIESGKLQLNPVPCNILTLVTDIRDMIGGQVSAKSIDFTVTTDGVSSPEVSIDPVRFHALLINLVSNAVKFTPEGGRIDVTLEQLDATAENAQFKLVVADNGIGMSPEFAEKVFEAFEREQTSTASGVEGTGLGMAIAKGVVDLMGGTISVQTEQGKGTAFTVCFGCPIATVEQSDQEDVDPSYSEDELEGMHVLLVEDNKLNSQIALAILQTWGVRVDTAFDGQQAVDAVKASSADPFDVVLMDVQMPVMGGYEATRAIREMDDPALSRLPISAMTANAFDEDRQAAFDAGMDAHLAKPLDIDEMKKVLCQLAKGAR